MELELGIGVFAAKKREGKLLEKDPTAKKIHGFTRLGYPGNAAAPEGRSGARISAGGIEKSLDIKDPRDKSIRDRILLK